MRYLNVSRKIHLTKEAEREDIKDLLFQRIKEAFQISEITETEQGFKLLATTGTEKRLIHHAKINVDIAVTKSRETVRTVIKGHSAPARSLLVSYAVLVLAVLLVGLLPGSIETDGANSGAMDALVLVILGIFIIFDIQQKVQEPHEILENILKSIDVEYG